MANIHGNEVSGRELLKKLIEDILSQKCGGGSEEKLWNRIFQQNDITIIPSTNPDGLDKRLEFENCCDNDDLEDYCIGSFKSFASQQRDVRGNDKKCRDWKWSKLTRHLWVEGRYSQDPNGVNIDMNRDFPDVAQFYYDDESTLFDRKKINQTAKNYERTFFQASETRGLAEFFDKNHFDYAVSYHDGAQVVSYALDKELGRFGVEPRDTDLFKFLARTYARQIKTSFCQPEYNNLFKLGEQGITNGAEWYSITGTSTDYQYIKYGTMPLTIEMSCNKFGPYDDISEIVKYHKSATLEFLKTLTKPKKPSEPYVSMVGSSKKLCGIRVDCARKKYDQKRVFFTHKESKEVYSTVPDKYGRFKKPLLKTGKYKINVRNIRQTQPRNKNIKKSGKKNSIEIDVGIFKPGNNQPGMFLDLSKDTKKWQHIVEFLKDDATISKRSE